MLINMLKTGKAFWLFQREVCLENCENRYNKKEDRALRSYALLYIRIEIVAK